jgi:transcriptional regulator with XRE-family HTH domain
MAEAIGVSVRTYQRIEDGERPVKRLELVALADRTGQDISFFGASSENGEAGTVNRSEGRVKPEGRLVG